MHNNPDTTRGARMTKLAAAVFVAISAVLFFVCMQFPAYTVSGHNGLHTTGVAEVLLFGWLGILYSMTEWYANPLLALSWAFTLCDQYLLSVLSGAASLYLALSFLERTRVILDEAPNYGVIVSRDSGYWLWIVCISLGLAGNLFPIVYRCLKKR